MLRVAVMKRGVVDIKGYRTLVTPLSAHEIKRGVSKTIVHTYHNRKLQGFNMMTMKQILFYQFCVRLNVNSNLLTQNLGVIM